MRILIGAVGVLAIAGLAAADTIRVPQDQPTIAAAETAAADGDTIQISKGKYMENVVVDVPNLIITGKGAVLDGNIAGADGICLDITSTGVTVQGLTFRNGSNHIRGAGGDLTVSKCTFIDSSTDTITIPSGNTLAISGCTFMGSSGETVFVTGSSDVTVMKCTFRSSGNEAIAITGADAHVEKNTINYTDDDQAVVIDGVDATVIKNKIFNSGDIGIEIDVGTNAVVSGNTVTMADNATGIYVDGTSALVEKNKVSDTDAGIEVYGNDAEVLGNTVKGIHGSEDGIEVQADNMKVIGNKVSFGFNECWGYYLYSMSATGGGVIENCQATGFMDAGFYVGYVSNPIYGVTSKNLKAVNSGAYDSYGFYVYGDANTLEKLSASNSDSTGILLAGGTGNDFISCTSKNSTGDGFRAFGTNNSFENCSASGAAEGFDNRGTGTVLTGGKYRGYRWDVTNDAGGGATFSGGLGTVNFVTGGSTQQSEID